MTTLTLRPEATSQLGSWTVVGAANAHTATSDNSDSSYIQLTPRCRLDTQRCRLAIPDISIPDGARIFSVGTRVRVQSVVGVAPQPRCLGWFRCHRPRNLVTVVVDLILFLIFGWRCPRHPTTAIWVEQQLEQFPTDPDGQPWTLESFNAFEVNLGRDDDFGNPLRISEVYVDVSYAEQPTVEVTGPIGAVTDTCRPTVTWEYASPQSDPQQAFRVAVYTEAQVLTAGFAPFASAATLESGWIFGEDQQWTLNGDIVNGDWYAYVQVQQAWTGPGEFESPVSFTTWTQDVTGAPNAVLQVAEFDPVFNRIRLKFAPSAPTPATAAFSVQASRDFGVTWVPVRNAVLVPADGTNTIEVFDYEAPLNVASQYRVLAYGLIDDLLFPADDYSNVLTVVPETPADAWWLKDPLNPELNTRIPVAYLGDQVTRQKSQGVYSVISGSNQAFKVVVTGPQYGIEGTLNLVFTKRDPEDYWTAFQRLDATGRVLLLQNPTGEQHYVVFGPGSSGSDMTSTWDVDPASKTRRYTLTQVSYTEVAAPPITS